MPGLQMIFQVSQHVSVLCMHFRLIFGIFVIKKTKKAVSLYICINFLIFGIFLPQGLEGTKKMRCPSYPRTWPKKWSVPPTSTTTIFQNCWFLIIGWSHIVVCTQVYVVLGRVGELVLKIVFKSLVSRTTIWRSRSGRSISPLYIQYCF